MIYILVKQYKYHQTYNIMPRKLRNRIILSSSSDDEEYDSSVEEPELVTKEPPNLLLQNPLIALAGMFGGKFGQVKFKDMPLQTEEEAEEEEDYELEEEEEEEYELEEGELMDVINWCEDEMMELMKEETPELYENFMEVRKYLETEMPTIEELLQLPMRLKDKARIIELYEVFMGCPPLSIEWIEAKQTLMVMIKMAKESHKSREKLDEDEIKKLESDIEMLNNALVGSDLELEISRLNLPFESKLKVFKKFKQLESMVPMQEEYGKLNEWMSVIFQIPWGVQHTITDPIETIVFNFKQHLDAEFYGRQKIKEQLMLYVHHRLQYPESKSYALGLVGSPGTGKSALSLLISKALSYPFFQISGGSLAHHDNIYGHSYTYVGSDTGEIVKSLMNMKAMNGILFIDEFDKITSQGNDSKSDKCLNTMLHILDPVQNNNFKDRYVGDIPIDLSKIWFILSMNHIPNNKPLSDRIFTIKIEDYTFQDKLEILERYTVPKLSKEVGIDVKFTPESLRAIVGYSKSDKGMRQTIKYMQDIFRKLCFLIHNPGVDISFKLNNWTVDVPITSEMINKIIHKSEKNSIPLSMYS
jgi:ATP-dependent Lon protease